MTKEESEKYIKSKMCNNCGVYLGGGNCSNNCNVIEAIQVLQEPKWIPVSEGLPKDDGLYLIYTEEQPFVCPFENNEFFIDDVLAWMQLPKPYEPQESEDKE